MQWSGLDEFESFSINLIFAFGTFTFFAVLALIFEIVDNRRSINRKIGTNFTVEVLGIARNVENQIKSDILSASRVRNVYVGTNDVDGVSTYNNWFKQRHSVV